MSSSQNITKGHYLIKDQILRDTIMRNGRRQSGEFKLRSCK